MNIDANTLNAAVIHDSEHWTNGGTWLTNFPQEHMDVYLEAARRFGNPAYVVSSTRMLGRGRNFPGGSLHYVSNDARFCPDSSDFWRVWDDVAKEMGVR